MRAQNVLSAGEGADGPAESVGTGALSAREREIVYLLAQGRSNRQIAEALGIASGTVKRHLANAYPKLGVTSRLAAALRIANGAADGRPAE